LRRVKRIELGKVARTPAGFHKPKKIDFKAGFGLPV
jgi:hypothetical protein